MQYLFAIYIMSNMGDFSKHRLEIRGEGKIITQIPKAQKYMYDCFSSHSVQSIIIENSLLESYCSSFKVIKSCMTE